MLGTSYTGKSWAASQLVRFSPRGKTVLVHNRLDRSYLTGGFSQQETQFIAVTGDSCVLPALFFFCVEKKIVWFTVYDLSKDQVQMFLASLVRAVKEYENIFLLIDEAHFFLNRSSVTDEVIGFVRGARRWGVDLLLITHRYTDIHVDIRCVLNHLALFRVTEGRDLDLLGQEVQLSSELVGAIPTLGLGEHIYIFRDSGYVSEIQKF